MKTRTASMRLSHEEYARLQRTADELGWSVSQLCHEIIFGDFFTKINSGILGSISNIKAQQEIERIMKGDMNDQ
tara:strand:- start:545 stop:766 length:222 start_codon:yes stop_codon:yes gene_type:complete